MSKGKTDKNIGLHTSWDVRPLGEVVQPTRPRIKPSEKPNLPFIGMENIEAHTMKLLGTVPAGTMKSSAVHFQPDDVLYGRLRPYLNKVYRPEFEGLCSAEFIVFPKTESISSRYLQYFLNSSSFASYASHLNAGDRPRVDFEQLSPYPFPVAPYEQQKRIVAEIEKQFSRLDESVATLKRVKANLKRYKASVLKSAVEGKLTEEWRKEHPNTEPASKLLERILAERRVKWNGKRKYKEPSSPNTSGLPNLPPGWTWAGWEQIGLSQNGRAFPSAQYQASGFKLLRPGNLHVSGKVVWTGDNTRCMPKKWVDEFPEFVVGPCELIMNLTAQSLKDEFLGRICLTGPGEACLLNQRQARLTPVSVIPEFLLWLFKSPVFRQFVDGLNTGSLIQHMFTSQLADFVLPLPSLGEQRQIVAEVECRLSVIEELEAAVEANLIRADRLRQSILSGAFSGKQFTQDKVPTHSEVNSVL